MSGSTFMQRYTVPPECGIDGLRIELPELRIMPDSRYFASKNFYNLRRFRGRSCESHSPENQKRQSLQTVFLFLSGKWCCINILKSLYINCIAKDRIRRINALVMCEYRRFGLFNSSKDIYVLCKGKLNLSNHNNYTKISLHLMYG